MLTWWVRDDDKDQSGKVVSGFVSGSKGLVMFGQFQNSYKGIEEVM